jgi:tight adherence protein B
MFGPTVTALAMGLLAMLSAGGLAYAFLFSRVEAENKIEKRIGAIADREKVVADRRNQLEQMTRKRGIQDAIKEFDSKQQAKTSRG